MDGGGTWSVPLTFPEPGPYRVFADFASAGRGLTLGDDLQVPGTYDPVPLPDPAGAERVGEYEVSLASDVVAGGDAALVFGVSRDGRPVEDLEPYLGALGHLSWLCAKATWPSSTSTPRRMMAPDPGSPSGRPSRARDTTASSCSSPTRAG